MFYHSVRICLDHNFYFGIIVETLLKRQAQKVFDEIQFGEDEKAQTNTFVLPVLLAEDKVHVDIFVLFCDTFNKHMINHLSFAWGTDDQRPNYVYHLFIMWMANSFIVYHTLSLRLNLKNKEWHWIIFTARLLVSETYITVGINVPACVCQCYYGPMLYPSFIFMEGLHWKATACKMYKNITLMVISSAFNVSD